MVQVHSARAGNTKCQNANDQNRLEGLQEVSMVLNLDHLNLELVSNFGLRI